MNINAYLTTYCDKTFAESPLNEVDSLVFSALSYLHYNNYMGFEPPKMTLKELSANTDTLVGRSYWPKSSRHLLNNAAACARYQNVKVGWFSSRYDEAETVQFAAMTFKLEDGTSVVTFRGTDITITGWKEDFSMAFLSEIPAQKLAVEYLNSVAAEEQGNLYVVGHSKGGNLAVYASVFGAAETRSRIIQVYNLDGPGFNESISNMPEYIELNDRITKLVPHDSLVGILLEHDNDYKVVACNSVNIGQHFPFTWMVEDSSSFKLKPKTTANSQIIDKTIYDFVAGLNDEDRKKFVVGLFTVLEGSGAKDLLELRTDVIKRLAGMTKAYWGLSGEVKILMAKGGFQFAKIWFNSVIKFRDDN